MTATNNCQDNQNLACFGNKGGSSMSSIDDLQDNTSVPFEKARAMPTSVYTDPTFLKTELSHIFAQDWFCVGRADALAKPGDYLTLDLANPVYVQPNLLNFIWAVTAN